MLKPHLFLLLAVGAAVAALPGLSCGGAGQEASVSQELSTDGGSVSLGDNITLLVPRGALSEDSVITITRASEQHPSPATLDAAILVGEAFELRMSGSGPAAPVTLEIAFDSDFLPPGASPSTLFVAYFDEVQQSWNLLLGEVDLERSIIRVETDHLSWWNLLSWNWSAWIAILNNVLTANLTDFLQAVALLTNDCPQQGQFTSVDDTHANNVVQGCIEADSATRPEFRAVNPKSFYFEVRPLSGHSYPQATLLAPGQSLGFVANPADSQPLVLSAEISQEAGWYLVVHLIIQMLPGLNQFDIQGAQVACITERIRDLSYIAAAAEALVVEHNGAAAAEQVGRLLLDDGAVRRFINAADNCLYGAAPTWSVEGLRQIGASTATIISATDFVANYFLNQNSSVSFFWTSPTPTPAPRPTPPPSPSTQTYATPLLALIAYFDTDPSGTYIDCNDLPPPQELLSPDTACYSFREARGDIELWGLGDPYGEGENVFLRRTAGGWQIIPQERCPPTTPFLECEYIWP